MSFYSQIPRMSNHWGFVLLGCVFTVAWFHLSKAQVESRITKNWGKQGSNYVVKIGIL